MVRYNHVYTVPSRCPNGELMLATPGERGSSKVSRMPSLTIKMIHAGDGQNYPHHSQIVAVHYDAYLSDGTLWDSSRARQKPLRFRLGIGQVIRGLDEGVMQLSLNERVRMWVPSAWAYGSRGFPGRVPPDTDIEFDLQLVDIV